jgi:uncharacterized damage-inducible protein DinB
MSTAEILLEDYDIEIASARRVLERIPDNLPDFKCHDKSMPFGRLAMHVATLPTFGTAILNTPGMNMANPTHKWPDMTFTTSANAVSTLDTNAKECRDTLASLSDAELAEPWIFSFGDHVITDGPRSLAYRHMFFNHLLHHRAQLSVYLRLNDIPVPGLYGPSADEPFNPTAK